MEELFERFELSLDRIREIKEELAGKQLAFSGYSFGEYFIDRAEYISFVLDNIKLEGRNESSETINFKLYEDIVGDNYSTSYSNPDYAEEKLGMYGAILSFVSAELQSLPVLACDRKLENIVILLELFLMLYGLFCEEEAPKLKEVEETVYYYAYDYIELIAFDRLQQTFVPNASGNEVAYEIIYGDEDFKDISYLYKYGEYISDSEIKLSQFLANMSQEEIDRLAFVYTDGFKRGFDVMGVDLTPKRSVNIRYHIGQERIVRAACKMFREMGLEPILSRCAQSRLVRRGVVKQGIETTPASRQFEYDHRLDDRFFLDARFVDRRINATEAAYAELADKVKEYAGPAVIETFGEELFSPVAKESVEPYSDEQQTLSTQMMSKLGQIGNKYLPGDEYSFTIIAFPLPDIGDSFEEIFAETVKVNSLDNDKYIRIQQSIIDVLDVADVVRIKGMAGNRTDMTVKMRVLEEPDKQTQFENCTADVNIPVGEVFTSPVLKCTHGVLNVSQVYLNGYSFRDLELIFEDGVVKDYTCKNFDGDDEALEKGKRYIKENILFNHSFLPIGEFAIGTNTVAYTMARRFDILEKLPILIVEKTGPHFAVGDTCYSHAEDHAVFNPDGKEIVSRDNDFSLLRDTKPDEAYFNCHTDITIPYNELGRLYTVNHDGSETDIIVEGRFVLPGTEELNEALDI